MILFSMYIFALIRSLDVAVAVVVVCLSMCITLVKCKCIVRWDSILLTLFYFNFFFSLN